MPALLNALTIDVEDYFMVSAFEASVPKVEWDRREPRVERNTRRILDLLDARGVKATFFTLGWVADRFPSLVREMAARGHEVACHGYHHRLIYDQTRDEFREDLRRAKGVLESACGAPVLGYRAPSFSVVEETLWALDILREEGFTYDASVMPAPHARGGLAGVDRRIHRRAGLALLPMSVLRFAGFTTPFSGGGYFRLFPEALVHWGIRRCHAADMPAVVYLHPWEFDPDQPRLPGRRTDVFKHYVNLDKTAGKLDGLLKAFRFGTAREVLENHPGLAA